MEKKALELYLSDPIKYKDNLECFANKYLHLPLRGFRREVIKVEEYCDMDFTDMTFTITKIEQEKLIDGVVTIWFIPNDGVDYDKGLNQITFNTKFIGNVDKITKELIRERMLSTYKDFKKQQQIFCVVSEGDII